MSTQPQRPATPSKRRRLLHRKAIALPYSTPPAVGRPTFAANLQTATELMAEHHTAA
ncbi:MAG: hypothetical protein H0W70_11945 [Actinobacteria bacterium]|nr:hypothetical protein [Actinomycetota bacterium]